MKRHYDYKSRLAPYIKGLIDQKRANGFIYEAEAYQLKRFDEFCIQQEFNSGTITQELIASWSIQRPTESPGYCRQRVSFVRQLALYMLSLGIDAYVPRKKLKSEKATVPHIISKDELLALFNAIDNYKPKRGYSLRLILEYKILFRLLYCCGMRISEGCYLKKENIDLDTGALRIIHSKGDKDRLIHLPEDLRVLCREYWKTIQDILPEGTEWFFPSTKPYKALNNTDIDSRFRLFWEMTPYAMTCDKRPTVHSLRHTFVVDRMNAWMMEGLDLNAMMPYLSNHLGHRSRPGTFYYYHQVEEAFRIVRDKDVKSQSVIPEVQPYEE